MLIYWFLPMILLLGIATSYEDVKYGKIRNKWIIASVAYSIVVNAMLFTLKYYSTDYLIKFLLNGSISLALGFIIWYANLWTAGDAKLFFVYSLLLPLNLYLSPISKVFPSILILSNAFVPFAIFLALFIVFKTINSNRFGYFKKMLSIKQLLQSVMFIFAFVWVLRLLMANVGLSPNRALYLIFLILLSNFFRLMNVDTLAISLLIALLRLFMDKSIFSINFVRELSIIAILYIPLRFLVLNLGYACFTKDIEISSLKEGMIPAEDILKVGKKFKKIKNINPIFKSYHKESLLKSGAKGLSKESIAVIRRITRNSNIRYIKIYQAVSFAPFLFISVMWIVYIGLYL